MQLHRINGRPEVGGRHNERRLLLTGDCNFMVHQSATIC